MGVSVVRLSASAALVAVIVAALFGLYHHAMAEIDAVVIGGQR